MDQLTTYFIGLDLILGDPVYYMSSNKYPRLGCQILHNVHAISLKYLRVECDGGSCVTLNHGCFVPHLGHAAVVV
jgi:hypothetical protein